MASAGVHEIGHRAGLTKAESLGIASELREDQLIEAEPWLDDEEKGPGIHLHAGRTAEQLGSNFMMNPLSASGGRSLARNQGEVGGGGSVDPERSREMVGVVL